MSLETAWLLEKHDLLKKPFWITVDRGMLTWTDDSNKALRLARRQDGELLAEIVEDADRIVEHAWPPGITIDVTPPFNPEHCPHFTQFPEPTHLLSRKGKPTLLLCDDCAEVLRQQGRPVKKIQHWLWGFPVVIVGEPTASSKPVVLAEGITVTETCPDFKLPASFTFDPKNKEEQAEIERRALEHLKTCPRCKAFVDTPVTGDVREYHFRCGHPETPHEWSVMAKPTFQIDFSPLCASDGCSYNGVYVGENQAEIAMNPADLLQN